MTEAILWKDDLYPERTIKVSLPLQSFVDPAQLANELHLPIYIDKKPLPIRKMLTILWASRFAHTWQQMFPERCSMTPISRPLNMVVLGGAAFKIHCPSSNKDNGPFNRAIGDVDFVVLKKHMKEARELILSVGKVCGSEYLSYATPSDALFNKLRGERLRFHTIKSVVEGGEPTVGMLDVLSEKIEMRHTIDVSNELQSLEENLYTIGLENMLLTKLQYIFDAPKQAIEDLEKSNQSFRILSRIYPHYDEKRVLVGMEEKDLRDTAALLLDHDPGTGSDQINVGKLSHVLDRDKKLRLTARLNLQNLADHVESLQQLGASSSKVDTIRGRIQRLLQSLPASDEKFRKPWWNTDIETPKIT